MKFHSASSEPGEGGKMSVKSNKLNIKELAFEKPFASSELFVFKGYTDYLSDIVEDISLDQIRCKFVAIPTKRNEEVIFVPLLHTLI